MSKTLLQIMNEVVNVRNFEDQIIPKKVLEEMFQAFILGPSSVSTQARELLVVDKTNTRHQIIDATLNPYFTKDSYGAQKWLLQAPFVAIVLIENRRAIARVGEIGERIAFQEAESAIQNFRLIAQSHGVCTTCLREFDPKKLKENLKLPWYIEPSAIITAGYCNDEIFSPPRLSISEVVSKEEWR